MEGNNKPLTADELVMNVTQQPSMVSMESFDYVTPYDAVEIAEQYAAQQTAWKDARIAEMEENYRQLAEGYNDYKQQTAALREELAVTEKIVGNYKSELDRSTAKRLRQAQLLQSYKDGPENMEAAKKGREVVVNALAIVREQRNELEGELYRVCAGIGRLKTGLVEAVDFLKYWRKDLIDDSEVAKRLDRFISRVSTIESINEKNNAIEKKLMFLFSDNADASNICMDLSGAMAWIEGDLEGLSEADTEDYEYTLQPVWMTQDEIDALPEADL